MVYTDMSYIRYNQYRTVAVLWCIQTCLTYDTISIKQWRYYGVYNFWNTLRTCMIHENNMAPDDMWCAENRRIIKVLKRRNEYTTDNTKVVEEETAQLVYIQSKSGR